MMLNGLVLGSQVLESTFYDQLTGIPKQGYSVKLTLLDVNTHEKYECQFSSGFAQLEQIKEMKQKGATPDQIEAFVQQFRADLPPQMTPLQVEVLRIKGKGSFHTLVCRFAQVAATV